MFYQKKGLPEEGELVMCKVTSIHFSSVFVQIQEYGVLQGHIHISEISPGRIRNIRDFVKEGKVITCKVLRVNQERNQVDLSLRRVTEMQRRLKVNMMKQEQKAETILTHAAEKLKLDPKKLYAEIAPKVFEKYESLYTCLEEYLNNKNVFIGLFPEKVVPVLTEIVAQRIKPPEVQIGGKLKVSSSESNGAEIIRTVLSKAEVIDKNISIYYLGGGTFNLSVTSSNYKDAEKILDQAVTFIQVEMGNQKSLAVFTREKAKS